MGDCGRLRESEFLFLAAFPAFSDTLPSRSVTVALLKILLAAIELLSGLESYGASASSIRGLFNSGTFTIIKVSCSCLFDAVLFYCRE